MSSVHIHSDEGPIVGLICGIGDVGEWAAVLIRQGTEDVALHMYGEDAIRRAIRTAVVVANEMHSVFVTAQVNGKVHFSPEGLTEAGVDELAAVLREAAKTK